MIHLKGDIEKSPRGDIQPDASMRPGRPRRGLTMLSNGTSFPLPIASVSLSTSISRSPEAMAACIFKCKTSQCKLIFIKRLQKYVFPNPHPIFPHTPTHATKHTRPSPTTMAKGDHAKTRNIWQARGPNRGSARLLLTLPFPLNFLATPSLSLHPSPTCPHQ